MKRCILKLLTRRQEHSKIIVSLHFLPFSVLIHSVLLLIVDRMRERLSCCTEIFYIVMFLSDAPRSGPLLTVEC